MAIPFGRYQLLKKIASGGMGQVLLAMKGENDFEKLVVIKRILPHLVEDEEFFAMFRDEAKITMRLDHPNIARINEFGVEEGVHFIEMEYVAGDDLRRLEKRAGSAKKHIPIGVIIRIIADAAAGLDFAHKARDSKGVGLYLVHRDVSPQNILVGFDGSVKLIDFGVAKAAGRAQHTSTGILKGKFPYMSPEQANGKDLDLRSDIFALGIILWEQLTGRRLFKGDSDLVTQRLVRTCQVPLPSSINPSVPAGLDSIVLKALAKRPNDRYQEAAEFRNALEAFALNNAISTSSGQLSAFMHELYAERIARESNPRFFTEDSGLTDLDVGGLSANATSPSRRKESVAKPAPVKHTTQSISPKTEISALKVSLALIVLIALGGGAWFAYQSDVPPKPIEAVVTTRVQHEDEVRPIPKSISAAPPLIVHIESEPAGALIELAGSRVGKTPFEASIERVKLPVAVRLSAEGYEAAEATLTDMTGPKLILALKKKPARPVTPNTQVKNPDIKTTR